MNEQSTKRIGKKTPDRAKAIKLEDVKIHEHTAHVHISV